MRKIILLLLALQLNLISFAHINYITADPIGITVPLGGNGWVNINAKARIRDNGITNWSEKSDVISVYFRVEKAGKAELSLKLNVQEGSSKISLTAAGTTLTKEIRNTEPTIISMGFISIRNPGYVKVELSGISKTGRVYAEVSDLIVAGPALEQGAAYVKDNDGNFFYWGHRGPSVHLNYQIPAAAANVEWFYNEIIVPEGGDVLGTYYMANGFSGGYFGMQTNSITERRVLFSIWSPFNTDNPKEIPDSMKVILLKKGPTTKTGEFGNEGSGGQSYMQYPWEAGKAYAFLVRAQPNVPKRSTVYTAYFKDIQQGEWQLVASFERPQSATYLRGLNSFLECFSPRTGDQVRKGHYQNQWAMDATGNWHEVTSASFTADNTARKNYRKDYSGGTDDKSFYLRNCGFFDDYTKIDSQLHRKPSGKPHPAIDFSKLP